MRDCGKISCGILEDLLPLVEDGVAGEESVQAVKRHLAECPECRKRYGDLEEGGRTVPDEMEKDDVRILKGIRDTVSKWVLLGILVSLALGALVVLSSSDGPWLTVILFPLICGVVYASGAKVWKWVPLAAAVFWIGISLLLDIGQTVNWRVTVTDSVVSAVFPLVLSYVGALAAALLKYAFKGEGK
ncbi:MAG: zf-HC2 domain-containing protein [Eubacteriales bacterium]|nr:zf-HC2 domain-containing protein [Eubacteriales bacterium]